MPSITLTFTAAQATRIKAWLATTPYPATEAGYKQAVTDWTKSMVKEVEDAKARQDALAAVQPAVDLVMT